MVHIFSLPKGRMFSRIGDIKQMNKNSEKKSKKLKTESDRYIKQRQM